MKPAHNKCLSESTDVCQIMGPTHNKRVSGKSAGAHRRLSESTNVCRSQQTSVGVHKRLSESTNVCRSPQTSIGIWFLRATKVCRNLAIRCDSDEISERSRERDALHVVVRELKHFSISVPIAPSFALCTNTTFSARNRDWDALQDNVKSAAAFVDICTDCSLVWTRSDSRQFCFFPPIDQLRSARIGKKRTSATGRRSFTSRRHTNK